MILTPKSDQFQISPEASPEILHLTVWRTWLFIVFSDERWLYYQFSLHHLCSSLITIGRMYFLSFGLKSNVIWVPGCTASFSAVYEQTPEAAVSSLSTGDQKSKRSVVRMFLSERGAFGGYSIYTQVKTHWMISCGSHATSSRSLISFVANFSFLLQLKTSRLLIPVHLTWTFGDWLRISRNWCVFRW